MNLSRISIPLLIQNLDEEKNSSANVLRSVLNPYDSTRVITGGEIDKSETDILHVATNLSVKKLRHFSYANLLYTELRSWLVHEYRLSDMASTFPMSSKGKDVSYVNNLNPTTMTTYRSIYFEYDWLEKVVGTLHTSTSSIWQKASTLEPDNWWIDGG